LLSNKVNQTQTTGSLFMDRKQLQMTVLSALMAALISVGAYLQIPLPLGPVPLVLQNLFVLLAGLLLGGRWGVASVGIYLLVGAIGLPVFVGGKGGIAHFLGPTGGYLLGFAVCAFVTGCLTGGLQNRMAKDVFAVILGSMMIYLCGVPWLKLVTSMSWEKAAMVGMLPFLPGDALKAAAAVILARAIRPMLRHQLAAVTTTP
jgi:biotin transport system substrate-specific component